MNLEERINNLLGEMSLIEKIGQLNQVRAPLKYDESIIERIKKGEIGSFIMATTAHAGNDETALANEKLIYELQKTAVEESPNGIPIVFGRDVIHGHNTVFPIPLAMAASFNEELVEKGYRDIAREAANDGVQWSFAPMLDISRDPRWGRCIESSGEDPYLTMKMAEAVVKGFQGDDLSQPYNIAACAKHYIGYGASEGGRDYHHTEITDSSIRNYYLKPFRAAAKSGVQTVMNAFNEIGGQPMVSNRYLMTDVLRGELGFDGFVIADYNAVSLQIKEGVAENGKQAAELALNAGTDMDMVDECYINNLAKSVEDGLVSMETIDEAVRRVLRVKFRLGLFENPYVPKLKIDREKHSKDARRLSDECIVLLKNSNNILPLKKNSKLTLTGPFLNERASLLGSWTLDGRAEDVTTVLEGIKSKLDGGKFWYTESNLTDDDLMTTRYSNMTVVVIGESRRVTGENCCIANIEVNKEYVDILKRAKGMGKPVIAVLCYGRPIALEEIEPYCDAILYCWHLGTEAGNAIADVLFGDVNPSGKLPMTLPKYTGQIPLYYNALRSPQDSDGYYEEKYCYRDCSNMPMYQFGYGLSYTNFEYSSIKASKNEIALEELKNGAKFELSVDVKNIGNCSGKEVVQLYIFDPFAKIVRPLKELKAYKKVEIAPNEALNVSFQIGFEELSYCMGTEQCIDKGEIQVFIGDSCFTNNSIKIQII